MDLSCMECLELPKEFTSIEFGVNEFVDASDFGRFADVNLDVIDTWLAADPVDSTCGDDGPVDVTTGALTGMLLVVDTTLPTDVICIDGGTLVG